ncbi:MAG: DUF1501 domain-containing protein [Planctomycetaceae bacterium]
MLDALTRRELFRRQAVLAAGAGIPAAASSAVPRQGSSTFGRAKSLIYLHLSGGPSQYETFDPKPHAPQEIRGSFSPISTQIPGEYFCELLPRSAAMADQFAVVRSLATDDPNHESADYWINTGRRYTGPNMRALSPTDWPSLGAVLRRIRPAERGPFTSLMLPEPIIANPNVFLPGQNAGFLGRRWDPEIIRCDPSAADFRVDGMTLPEEVSVTRFGRRQNLLSQLEQHQPTDSALVREFGNLQLDAAQLLRSGVAEGAFAIDREPAALRDRYGRGKWGQSVLLARRLVEAGVRMVFVQWPREPGDLSSPNPVWDTHASNDARMKDVLCPQFDLGFTALLDDLKTRGLLDETLVVAVGEMGRTPKFNASGGRDHWGNVFSFAIAGAGAPGGLVHGASDRTGAWPEQGRVSPSQLFATILHFLGVRSDETFPDPAGRPMRVVEEEPISALTRETAFAG